mgnify:CR=1 FL=1|tara:strand:+ start:524 stop:1036 length:513 start_codon:yes stop_codon:yes gene_type:complete
MKKLVFLFFIFSYAFTQTNCELCVEQNGFYCGDDESNWTQYSPNGCVPNGQNGLFYLNDGWLDCVDGADEQEATPTTIEECDIYNMGDTIFITDTLYIDIVDTLYISTTDTLIITEYIDCLTGLPCDNTGIIEILNKSKTENKIYNIEGKEIYRRKGLYIENGKINFKLK